MQLVCKANSDCAKAAPVVAGEIKQDSDSAAVLVDGPTGARFNLTYLSTSTIADHDLVTKGYTGTCTYGANSKEATFCPEEPAISLSDNAMADGNA